MSSTTTAVTVAEDVRLDLGHTDLVGDLVFDGAALSLITAHGTHHALGQRAFICSSCATMFAPESGIGLGLGCVRQTRRHACLSLRGAEVVELVFTGAGSAVASAFPCAEDSE